MPAASLRAVAGAVSFLTLVPVGRVVALDARDVARGTLFFPLVGAGIGAAIVPRLAADPRDTLTVAKPLPGVPPRTLAIVWHRDRTLAPAARAFVEDAEHVCRELSGDQPVARIA